MGVTRTTEDGKMDVDDEPVVKLSSYLRLHELQSALFGFVKIANGDARGETLERPASRHRCPYPR